jgi:hypothetical protein
MTEQSPEAPAAPAGRHTAGRANRWTLWLVLAVCVAPFAGSLALYHFSPPDSRMNYGELTEPRPLPGLPMSRADGAPFNLAELRGKWIMLQADGGACEAACRDKLYKMRQVRRTTGKDMDRIERIWLLTDDVPVDAALLQEHEGLVLVRAAGSAMLREVFAARPPGAPPTATVSEPIWLVDPLGNLMLRWPAKADPTRMKKDVTRLLRVSRIG